MNKDFLKKIFSIIDRKFVVNSKQCEDPKNAWLEKWLTWDFYFDAMIDEIEESRPHSKINNEVFLEDELWDILWDYMNMIYLLEKEWKIKWRSVFEKVLKKYNERTLALEKWISWSEIKKEQKERLLKEHNKKYNA